MHLNFDAMRVDIVLSENIQMCLPAMFMMQTCLVPAYCQEPMHFCVNPQFLMMIFPVLKYLQLHH